MVHRYGAQAAASQTVALMDQALHPIRHKLTTAEWFDIRMAMLELIHHERKDALASYVNMVQL